MIEIIKGLNIATYDIETTDLNAIYGHLLCACVKPYNKPVKTFRIDDKRNHTLKSDRWVVEQTIKELNKYDVLVGWYTTRFDRPFLNTRALIHRIGLIKPHYSRDLIYFSRFRLKMISNKLKFVHMNLFGKTNKTVITPQIKDDAIRREKYALDFIVRHCQIDVRETEDLYSVFLPHLGKKLTIK